MYTLNRGPTKLAVHTRRAPTQQIERLDLREPNKREPSGPAAMSSPRPTFNGKKANVNRPPSSNMAQEPLTQQHEETVRFVLSAWQQVQKEREKSSIQGREGPQYYQEKHENPKLKDFEPFDLEAWWGKRMLEKVHS